MTALKAQPETLDLHLYSGDGVTIVLEFLNDDDSTPFPTTGVWLAEIRSSLDPSLLLTEFTITNDEPTGTLKLSLSGEQVRSIWPKAIYDLQQTEPGAEPRTWYRGTITIEGDVSRG